jgi:proteic killer suppression protein
MEVEFRDAKLALVETDRAADTKLSEGLINSLRDKLVVIRAATDERTLRNWRSLHYEKLVGRPGEQRSIRLNKQWRLVFTIDTTVRPNKITVLGVEDYH